MPSKLESVFSVWGLGGGMIYENCESSPKGKVFVGGRTTKLMKKPPWNSIGSGFYSSL